MFNAVKKVVEYMDEKNLSTEERLTLLGSVSRLNGDAVKVKSILQEEGLNENEQRQAIAAIRTMLKPRKKPEKKDKKGGKQGKDVEVI